MGLIGTVIAGAVWIFLGLLTVRLVLSWVPALVRDWEPRGIMVVISEFVYTVTDPPIRFLGRFIPPLRVGDLRLDLAFLVLYLALWLVLRWLPS